MPPFDGAREDMERRWAPAEELLVTPSGAAMTRAAPRRPWVARAMLAARLLLAAAPCSAETSCPGEIAEDVVRSVGQGGEIALASGRAIVLADLRLPEDGAAERLGFLAGARVQVRAVGKPDRWGRIAAAVDLAGAAPVDLAELLVGEGFAMVDSGERDALCRPDLLGLEATARARRLGLWAKAGRTIAATDRERLAAADGRFAIVEGRIVSVGERQQRTYLNFGRDFSRDFSVTIPKRVWSRLRARPGGGDLAGRNVRVRGLIETRRAPAIDLTVPDMLELEPRPPAR